MNGPDWQRVKEVFALASEQPRERRAAFLREVCAGDAALRGEVESLLDAADETAPLLESDGFSLSALLRASGAAYEGKEFGRYRIVRELGRGGMGAVFLAERADGEFRQQVALKIMRRSFADHELARRFRQERQILASLNHPNIARLLDGGVSADGEPFLAMEYVEGLRIDEYCDGRDLAVPARLKLFLAVCRGVSYAHQNLIIHRDIKPSNILVTTDGAPKLLDFGIAKLLDAEHADERTQTGLRAFTPEYAAPEQVRGERVTTTSDVYSLGVLLRDLLGAGRTGPGAGRAPESEGRTVAANLPTKREAGGAKESGRRAADAELRNIVAMATREEPARRYASVAQFAEDVQRYLEGLPVRAQKDSLTYRAGKFVRRHKAGVAAAALVLLSLVGGILATAWQARIARQERDRARAEAAKAERINAFLQNVLGFSDPTWVSPNPRRNREATIAEALDEAGRRAESELADQPEVLAAVRFTIGWTYRHSRMDVAESHLRAALDIRRRVLGPEHQDTAQSMVGLGELQILRGNFEEARALDTEAVAVYRRAGGADSKWFAIALSDLGMAQMRLGDAAAAEASYREALEVAADSASPERTLVALLYSNVGAARREQGDLDGAASYLQKSLEEHRRLPGEPRFELGGALINLAGVLTLKGDFDRAEPLAREAFEVFRNTVGEKNQYTARPPVTLAEIYYGRGDYGRARVEVDRALALQKGALPEGHLDFAMSWTVLGKILTREGDAAGGESHLRRALELRGRLLPRGHWQIAYAQGALGECLSARARYAEAEPLLVESHDGLHAGLGPQDPRTREARHRLAALYQALGKPDMAERFRRL
jgi:tetratricopeptide (TPR) repeat protein/predicted Ser/Thr protein kinase